MNRLVLAATLVHRAAMRYTPAGLPALEVGLKHESDVSEDSRPRKVSMELRAIGIGQVTQALTALALGESALFAGFLAASRNGRGLLFHITTVEPAPPSGAALVPTATISGVHHAPSPR